VPNVKICENQNASEQRQVSQSQGDTVVKVIKEQDRDVQYSISLRIQTQVAEVLKSGILSGPSNGIEVHILNAVASD